MVVLRGTKVKHKRSTKARAARAVKSVTEARTASPSCPTNLVVYIHGIGNKPRESALKAQWDRALFGRGMGAATRMAYWVNRQRYLIPEPDENAELTLSDIHSELYGSASNLRPSVTPGESHEDFVATLTSITSERTLLEQISGRLRFGSIAPDNTHSIPATEIEKKVLPFGESVRESLTKWLTRKLLVDVYDFLFVESERKRMCDALTSRLTQGSGPTIVVAHSQGAMIAYKALFDLSKTQPTLEVPLLVTMGSPLGMQEVIDNMRRWTGVTHGKLPRPGCVKRWINISERLDPVSSDRSLRDEYDLGDNGEEEMGLRVNPHFKTNPHSPTGYLSTPFVRKHIREAVGRRFAHPIRPFVVSRDLVTAMANAPEARHSVLISLASVDGIAPESKTDDAGDSTREATAVKHRIIERIQALVEKTTGSLSFDLAEVEVLRKFVAARLTRREIETLQAENASLTIDKIWRHRIKR